MTLATAGESFPAVAFRKSALIQTLVSRGAAGCLSRLDLGWDRLEDERDGRDEGGDEQSSARPCWPVSLFLSRSNIYHPFSRCLECR